MSDIERVGDLPLITLAPGTEITFRVPRIPNYILGQLEADKRSIADFTDEQLEAIGDAWTVQLIAKAHRKRREERVDVERA